MSTTSKILYHRGIALAFHGNQLYGDLPYSVHLEQVVEIAKTFSSECPTANYLDIMLAAYYHDVLEDTELKTHQLRAITNQVVTDAVFACTDAHGKNRYERKHGTFSEPGPYVKLQSNPLGLYIKLCDRLANVRASKARRKKFNLAGKKDTFDMYKAEQAEFESLLRQPDQYDTLWNAINKELDNE